MERRFLTPKEIAEHTVRAGVKKVNLPLLNQLILGILAGAFIAFAAEGSNMAAFNLFSNSETYGLGKVLAGAIFGTGLMLVIIAGGELFTGNTLIVLSLLEKKVKISHMLKNWGIVYIGNLIGSIFIAYMIVESGLLNSGDHMLGAITIKIAAYKIGLPFMSAFFLGIMCNWLVCLAVWIAYSAKDITGKILGIFFPIWLFITSGFEHSVANMYYIPAGIMAKANENWAIASNLPIENLSQLNWLTFFTHNLVPVTLGNIVGGSFCVAMLYWIVYLKENNTQNNESLS